MPADLGIAAGFLTATSSSPIDSRALGSGTFHSCAAVTWLKKCERGALLE
jgi:hypothetical protein